MTICFRICITIRFQIQSLKLPQHKSEIPQLEKYGYGSMA
jgi:hypothetical protein